MKILVFGSNGFIGRAVVGVLSEFHEVYRADRVSDGSKNSRAVDLLDQASVVAILEDLKPKVVVNCAGSVENSDKALAINPIITLNILQAIISTQISLNKMIVCGSAGEYGIVQEDVAVGEDTPLMGNSFYARSKIFESSIALAFVDSLDIPVIVTRIFNPIGAGMHPRFLLPKLIGQAQKIRAGENVEVEVSRLDAKRDYINVLDIAEAIKLIVENNCPHRVYNLGSGKATTNKQLMREVFKQQGVSAMDINVKETSPSPEPNYASCADISRMEVDFGWRSKYGLAETISQIAEQIAEEKLNG